MSKKKDVQGVPAKKRSRASAVASLRSPKKAEPRAPARSRARAQAHKLSGEYCKTVGHHTLRSIISENGLHGYCIHCGTPRP